MQGSTLFIHAVPSAALFRAVPLNEHGCAAQLERDGPWTWVETWPLLADGQPDPAGAWSTVEEVEPDFLAALSSALGVLVGPLCDTTAAPCPLPARCRCAVRPHEAVHHHDAMGLPPAPPGLPRATHSHVGPSGAVRFCAGPMVVP